MTFNNHKIFHPFRIMNLNIVIFTLTIHQTISLPFFPPYIVTNIRLPHLHNIFPTIYKSINVHHAFIPLNERHNTPNPLNYETGFIRHLTKRQQEANPEVNNNQQALLESFGGNSNNDQIENNTNGDRQTGVYYLIDWNTFLDVDNQMGRRVNLRFQPKIGDPKRFLHITVP